MRRFFTFLTLSLFLILIDFLDLTGSVKALVEKRSESIKGGVYQIGSTFKFQIANRTYSWQETGDLRKKTEELARKLAQLEVENSELKKDNDAMQRLLQAPLAPDWQFLPAKTLGLGRYLTINKGKRDGVKTGMVVVRENILVGKVVRTSEKSAKIMLPTDSESKIAVKVGRVRGVLVGENGRLFLTEVLQGKKIEIDNLVVTSAEKEIFPLNLLIGKIKSVEKEEREPYQKAEVEPLINYDQLERVFLILD